MVDYHFKDWLTIEESAAWLTDHAGKGYTTDAVERALEKGYLWPYYHPQSGDLGLFPQLTPYDRGYKFEGRALQFIGPAALLDYAGFKEAAKSSALVGAYVGSSLDLKGDEQLRSGFEWVYLVGDKGEPVSLASHPHKILIRLVDLERFVSGFPKIELSPRPVLRTPLVPPGDREGFLAGFPKLDPLTHAVLEARSWRRVALFDMDAAEAFTPSIDHPPLEQPPKKQGQHIQDDIGSLKALGFAAHLIADLADQLDTHLHGDKQTTKHLRLKLKTGRPNASKIAEQLKKTATKLKHTGHGYGASGFEETLRRALTELSQD